jgi:outer membrane protein
MKKTVTGLLATAMTAGMLGMTPAAAYDEGTFIARAGAAGVHPTSESEDLSGLGKVEADNAWSLGLTFTYMAADNVGFGLLAAWPFEHDIKGSDGALDGVGDVAETKQLPPTVTLQYYFDTPVKKLHPFLGAGINYTYFFDEDTKGILSGTDIDIDSSWGWALEAGLDFEVTDNWTIGAQVYYIDIEPQADIKALGKTYDVDINPWVYVVSVGRKF